MLQLLIWISLLASSVYSWHLKTSHSDVIVGLTENVTLSCPTGSPPLKRGRPILSQVSRIRFLKLIDGKSWKPLAEIAFPNVSQVNFSHSPVPELIASGHLGRQKESFLSLTWSTASKDTVGSYKCEVDGFSIHDRSDYHVNSAVINITSNEPSTTDLVDIIIQMRAKEKELYGQLEDLEGQRRLDNVKLEQTMEDLDVNQTLTILDKVKSMDEDNQVTRRYWPWGNYSLLATADSCVGDSPHDNSMLDGYIKLMYDRNGNQSHRVSHPNHWRQPFYKRCDSRHILTLSFCTKRTSNAVKIEWPRGSYCIHPDGGFKCPPKFKSGEINFHLQTPTLILEHKNQPSDWSGGTPHYYEYRVCCRHDKSPDKPITLPTTKPFYLYRHTGKCQAVSGMDVENEWLEYQVDNSRNKWYDLHAQVDSTLGPHVRLELCYYKKRT